jgi:hypothetical protein
LATASAPGGSADERLASVVTTSSTGGFDAHEESEKTSESARDTHGKKRRTLRTPSFRVVCALFRASIFLKPY